jgi:hypothetical protein
MTADRYAGNVRVQRYTNLEGARPPGGDGADSAH